MVCEVCGRKIYGKPRRVIIEGAKLTVCSECAKLGKILWEETEPETPIAKLGKTAKSIPLKTPSKKPQQIVVDTTLELTEHFDAKIRQAREKLGFSHEELGKKIAEKASVLKKIETGKMTPNNVLVAKLEHSLKIKLLVPATEEKIPQKIPKPTSRELTLGDLIKLNKKDKEKEEQEERKQF